MRSFSCTRNKLLVFVGEVQSDFEEGFSEGVDVELVHVGNDDDGGGLGAMRAAVEKWRGGLTESRGSLYHRVAEVM
jgi:hypothetical protein